MAQLPARNGNQLHYERASLQGKKAQSRASRCASPERPNQIIFVGFHPALMEAPWETLGQWDAKAQGGTLNGAGAIIRRPDSGGKW